MRLFVKVLAAIVALTVVSGIGMVLYLVFADLGEYKTDIEEGVLDATGFELSIGEFELEVGGKTVLTAEQVVVNNPEYPEASQMAALGRLHLVIDTWSLLGNEVNLEVFELQDVDISLHQQDGGAANWHATPRQRPIPIPEEEMNRAELILHALSMENVTVSYAVADQDPVNVRLDRLVLDRQLDGSIQYAFAGRLGAARLDTPVSGEGTFRAENQHQLSTEGAFALQIGAFDASVSLQSDGDKPSIQATIDSPRLDLRNIDGVDDEVSGQQAANNSPGVEAGPVFGDEPLDFSVLDAANVHAEIAIGEILLDGDTWTDVNATIALTEGNLAVEPFGVSSREGDLGGRFGLSSDGGLYALDIDVQVSNLRIGALGSVGQDPATIPPLDARLVLNGRGASMHDIMAGANGSLKGSQQAGQIDLQAAGVLFADLVASIFRAINPLAEPETVTTLECGLYDVSIVDGVATVEQLALQSDRLTIIGSGSIDLDTEAIDMTLRTRTREGFGLSLGGVVNSFLKLGGTLGAPSVGMDAAGSVTTTGAAVMTGGLSLVARGLFDRVSAEADLCTALEDAEIEAAPGE